jgi:hypothetical protein
VKNKPKIKVVTTRNPIVCVQRGGGFFFVTLFCCSACRYGDLVGFDEDGFRLVKPIKRAK